jgi:hypothetical protein
MSGPVYLEHLDRIWPSWTRAAEEQLECHPERIEGLLVATTGPGYTQLAAGGKEQFALRGRRSWRPNVGAGG